MPEVYNEFTFSLREEDIPAAEELLTIHECHEFFFDQRPSTQPCLKIYTPNKHLPSALVDDLAKMGLECNFPLQLNEVDWLKEWLDSLTPFELVKDVWINPLPNTPMTVPPTAIGIDLVPGSAFGTGLHDTTALAAELIQQVGCKGKRVIDIGCGTGILGLMAQKTGASSVICLDENELAVIKTQEVITINGEPSIQVCLSDLLESVSPNQQYDLIIANIICEVLERLLETPTLLQLCIPSTQLVFSGVSQSKRDRMINSLKKSPFRIDDELRRGNWCAFLLTPDNPA